MARGTESKKNKRQESDQTVLTTRKRLPKRLIVLVKPKKWRVRQKISGASRLTCASHLSTSDASDMMNFWNNLVNIYDKLSLIAQDILAVPASQAYIERGFSVCGLLTAGRRNRMTKSLQMRACLKLKKKVLANTGINASV